MRMLEESIPSIWASMSSWFTPTVLFVLVNLVIGTIAVTSKSHHPRTGSNGEEEDHPHRPRAISRSSSVLQRLRSIRLSRHSPPELDTRLEEAAPAPAAAAVAVAVAIAGEKKAGVGATMEKAYAAVAEEEDEGVAVAGKVKAGVGASMEEAYAAAAAARAAEEEEDEGRFKRSQSDSRTVKAATPGEKARVQRKLRKAASDVSAFGRADDGEIGVALPPPPPPSAREWRRRNHFGLDEEEEEEEEEKGGGGEVDAKADDFISKFRKQLLLQRMESMMRNKQMQQQQM